MRTKVNRIFLLATVVAIVAVMSGCQAESTTPPTTTTGAEKSAGAGAGAGAPTKPGGAMSTGVEAAPAGADTSLKGGMK
jgi:hypothetical protein